MYQFVSAMSGSNRERAGILQWTWFFLPYLISLAGVYLVWGGRRSSASTERDGSRLLKVIVGGWAAGGGVFILVLLLALAFHWSAGVDLLFDYFLPIVIALTVVMSLTVMRKLR